MPDFSPLQVADYGKFMTSRGESEFRYELNAGHLVVHPAPTATQEAIIARCWMYWYAHLKHGNTRQRITKGGSQAFLLAPDPTATVWVPALALLDSAAMATFGMLDYVTEAVPQVVVEVAAPGQTQDDLAQRAEAWLDYGVQAVWAMQPAADVIGVFGVNRAHWLHRGDTLQTDLIPDFAIGVSSLFD